MPKITFLLSDRNEHTVAFTPGHTAMETAIANNVPGILGECGGNLSCATCHVRIPPEHADRFDALSEMEDAMLDGALDRGATSRLGCQLRLEARHDGIVVEVPEEQA